MYGENLIVLQRIFFPKYWQNKFYAEIEIGTASSKILTVSVLRYRYRYVGKPLLEHSLLFGIFTKTQLTSHSC